MRPASRPVVLRCRSAPPLGAIKNGVFQAAHFGAPPCRMGRNWRFLRSSPFPFRPFPWPLPGCHSRKGGRAVPRTPMLDRSVCAMCMSLHATFLIAPVPEYPQLSSFARFHQRAHHKASQQSLYPRAVSWEQQMCSIPKCMMWCVCECVPSCCRVVPATASLTSAHHSPVTSIIKHVHRSLPRVYSSPWLLAGSVF